MSDCGDPGCTGRHGGSSPWAVRCPASRERGAPNEVRLVPGRCLAWTASAGLCPEPPAPGLPVCAGHAWDFDPASKARARCRLTDEDLAYLETVPAADRDRERRRLSARAYRAKQAPKSAA